MLNGHALIIVCTALYEIFRVQHQCVQLGARNKSAVSEHVTYVHRVYCEFGPCAAPSLVVIVAPKKKSLRASWKSRATFRSYARPMLRPLVEEVLARLVQTSDKKIMVDPLAPSVPICKQDLHKKGATKFFLITDLTLSCRDLFNNLQ